MSKGFVAAPLLGTLIFLASVIFVVHMTQLEKSAVTSIVNDIYHARVSSMLEDYRYDMGSLFSVSLSRAIENYLSSECWNVFSLNNENLGVFGANTRGTAPVGFPGSADVDYDDIPFCNNVKPAPAGSSRACSENRFASSSPSSPNYDSICAENCNGQLDYHELRYRKCAQTTDIIKDGICPHNVKFGLSAWLKSTRKPFNFEGISFSVSNGDLVAETVSQMGCRISSNGKLVTSREMFDYTAPRPASGADCAGTAKCRHEDGSSCSGKTGKLEVGGGIKYCRELIGNSLFDCRNFAENDDPAKAFRCCDRFATDGRCCLPGMGPSTGCDNSDHVVPGCEQGSFFVNVNVLASDEVYKRLPRVNATDKSGNQIQSGALGDRNFAVHVKYPFYKYLDAAFRLYAPVAYGISGSADDFSEPSANMRKLKGGGKGRGGELPQDANEGVVEGVCYGLNCNDFVRNQDRNSGVGILDAKKFKRKVSAPVDNLPNTDALARKQATEKFVDTFFGPSGVCRLFSKPPQNPRGVCDLFGLCETSVYLSRGGLTTAYRLCDGSEGPSQVAAIKAELAASQLAQAEGCPNPYDATKCAVIDNLRFTIEFRDRKPETLVNPEANKFCWHLRPEHYNPEEKVK